MHTERLRLREIETTDADAMYVWHVDPRYLEHYPVERMSIQDTRDLVERFIGWQRELPRWRWQLALELRESGVLIGSCGVRRTTVDATTADVGYELNPEVWGRGYATEALRAMVEFAFADLGLSELNARSVDTNARSIRLLESLGFSHALSLSPGRGRDGRFWPERSEYQLPRDRWRSAQP